jgi:diaminohydroxyphosphoribosylaminopyrimidine deaminase/5-amino-6-(5-phosphoribosylamino)uracil reductase
MASFAAEDHEFMARALRLARRGIYTAHPNPRVGCVLVHDGAVVGEGWHRQTGEVHAEINAIESAGDAARGSTAYVTLEPCSHHGKTPPCSDALIDAGVAKVVYAMADPNPEVSGSAVLESAGLAVIGGVMESQASELNRGFVSRMNRGRPFVRLKIAASLDGRTAMASGESQWITGPESRADVQRLRAESGAILTGVGTVIDDDPSLTVRDESIDTGGRQPLRAVVDSGLRMSPNSTMLKLDGDTLVFCCNDSNREALESAGAEVVMLPTGGDRVDLSAVLANLGSRNVNDVLAECGPTLAGALLEARLVDELVIYQAAHIMGSETRGLAVTPGWQKLKERLPLEITDIRKTGRDIRITARPEV